MIQIEEIMAHRDTLRRIETYKFKVSLWGRLKFLFKGYKAEFEIPQEVLLDTKANWRRVGGLYG